jgi:hypothetical protein
MVIAERWRGREADEAGLHQNAHPKGHELGLATSLPGALQPTLASVADLVVVLRQDCVVIVKVSGPRWVAWLEGQALALQSPHGRMCAPGEMGPPMHALVVVERLANAFRVRDPWFAAEGQPIEVDDDSFDYFWAGEGVVVPRDPTVPATLGGERLTAGTGARPA